MVLHAVASDTTFTVQWEPTPAALLAPNVYQTFAVGTGFPDYITNSPTVTANGNLRSASFTLPALLAKSAAAPSVGVQVCTPVAGGVAGAGTCTRVAAATALTQCGGGRKLKML